MNEIDLAAPWNGCVAWRVVRSHLTNKIMRRRIPTISAQPKAQIVPPWRIHGASMAAQSNVMSVSCQLSAVWQICWAGAQRL